MTPYDLNTNILLPENKGTNFAKKTRTKKKIFLAIIIIWAVAAVLFSLWITIGRRADTSTVSFFALIAIGECAIVIFYLAAVYFDTDKLLKMDMTIQERHDYNLAQYRSVCKKNQLQSANFLLAMAQEDIQMEKYHDAELALEQIDRIHLEKKMLKSYYLLGAAASYFQGKEDWEIQLVRCAAVPVKDMILPDEELKKLFMDGDSQQILSAIAQWKWLTISYNYKKMGVQAVISGILILLTLAFWWKQRFFAGIGIHYMLYSYGAFVLLFISWIVYLTYMVLSRIADRKKQITEKSARRSGTIRLLILWVALMCLCLLVGFLTIVQIADNARSTERITWEQVEECYVSSGYSDESILEEQGSFSGFSLQNMKGTWYCDSTQEVLRFAGDGVYVYSPASGCYGSDLYDWKILGGTNYDGCLELQIYVSEEEQISYFINGWADDYFWCSDEGAVFYRQ